MAEVAPPVNGANGVAPEGEVKKPGRGRPKDDQAPPKPKNAFQRVTGEARAKLKAERPDLATDLKALGLALKEAWENTPEPEKERLSKQYEAEMEVWRPKWAVYKETAHYKEFFEIKQDWVDMKTKKKLIKKHTKGKTTEGSKIRVGANFSHEFGEDDPKNYKLTAGLKGTVTAEKIDELDSIKIEFEGLGEKVYLKKYFGKLEDPDIPKRPKSGYMLFGGEVRERAQKEVFDAGGSLSDVGKKISDWWQELPETKKAEYGEQSGRMKEVFDVAWGKYKVTDKFKQFENTKVNLESTQKLKKLTRTKLADKPKSAPSAFSMWKVEANKKLMEDNKSKGITMSMGELGKKLGELWKDVPQAEKDELGKKCEGLKAAYEEKAKNFKKNQKYMQFLEERQKVKIRQNRLVNLRDMPKKPRGVFALYAAKHKDEVPAGKGEGKGISALKQKFVAADVEEKTTLAAQAKEAEEKWKQELEEFKAGDKFKTYTSTETKVKREFMNEAMKVMTLKFITAAPEQPPKSPFSIFLGDKRKAENGAAGEPKSKKAKQDEVVKYKAEWDKLDRGVKDEFEEKRKERLVSWKEEVRSFMEQDLWKEYLKEARRLKVPIKQLLSDKKNVIKKLKNGMRFVPLPEKPEIVPSKPPNAYKLFFREKKKEVAELEKIDAMWKELDADGKKTYLDQAAELLATFQQDMRDFKASDEGKKYLRTMGTALRTRRVVKAKFTFLKDLPKKPDSALKTYIETNTKAEKKANPELKGFEVRKKLTDKWLAMPAEERKQFEDAAKEKLDKYDEDMKAFKASDNWIKYSKAVKTKGKAKAKATPSGKAPPAPKKPEDMPKKPKTAFEEFKAEQGETDMDAQAMEAAFGDLSDEKKEEFETKAKEATEKYDEEMAEWKKSESGMGYQNALVKYEKLKKANELKARLAKVSVSAPKVPEGMPVRPKNAFKLYCSDMTGKGMDLGALHRGWTTIEKEKKDEFEEAAKAQEAKYKEDVEEFNKSEAGKKYYKMLAIYEKRKRVGEAKARFLGDMPKRPEGSFQIFLAERRARVMAENPDLKGLGAVMGKLSTIWKEMPAEEKQEFENKEKEAKQEYAEKMRAFEQSADYKRYKSIENKVNGSKSKDKAKAAPAGPPAPKAPENMPQRPPMAFLLFKQETGGAPKDLQQKWLALGAEGQKEWNEKAKEKMDQYEKDMKEFQKTADGKKYLRLKAAFEKKQAEKRVKDRFLGGADAPKEPKRPPAAYFIFCNDKRAEVSKELGSSKMGEVALALSKKWSSLPAEEKSAFEKQAADAKAEYEQQMTEYKNSDAVKKFDRAMSGINKKPKSKAKPKKAAGKGRGAPAGRGGAAKGRGRGAAAKADDSDSDVMGSDSDNSSSSDSDSD